MTKPEDVDDMLSELSTPGLQDIDFAAQRLMIENLSRHSESRLTVDKEELDLQECFKQLQGGSGLKEKEFDDAVSQMSESLSASSSQRNFYKPQLKQTTTVPQNRDQQ